MGNIVASIGKSGMSILEYFGKGAIRKSYRAVPQMEMQTSIYEYANKIFQTYPEALQNVIKDLNGGRFATCGGEIFKSAGQRVLPNGNVYKCTRHIGQDGVEWLNAELTDGAGKLISSKRKTFINGSAQMQEKSNYLTGDIKDLCVQKSFI